jgi:hypothetical protein
VDLVLQKELCKIGVFLEILSFSNFEQTKHMTIQDELNRAIETNNIAAINAALDAGAQIVNDATFPNGNRNYYNDTLRIAIDAKSSIEVIRLLLERGAQIVNDAIDPHSRDRSRHYWNDTLRRAFETEAGIEIIELLLKSGAQIVNDATFPEGNRAYCDDTLYSAIKKGASTKAIELLLKSGAQIVNDVIDPDGSINYCNRTLHSAIEAKSSIEVIRLLLKSGAQIINDATSRHGRFYKNDTLYVAITNKANADVIDLLLLAGADPTQFPATDNKRESLLGRKDQLIKENIATATEIARAAHNNSPNSLLANKLGGEIGIFREISEYLIEATGKEQARLKGVFESVKKIVENKADSQKASPNSTIAISNQTQTSSLGGSNLSGKGK